MQTTTLRALAAVGGAALVLAGCGLKEGVVVVGEGGVAGAPVGTENPTAPTGTASPVAGSDDATAAPGIDNPETADDPGAGAGGAGGGAGGGGATGGEAPGAGDQGGGSAGGGGGGQAFRVSGSDRTGVTDSTIRIGIHAPVTGAAPLPSRSFEQAGDTYWLWKTQQKNETILGRTSVQVEFADDKYDPNTARGICRDLASRNFMVVGGGGTDQIQACGALAGVSGFPYFSPGVTEAGLETANNPWYFAGSMSYKQQASLLAAYIKNRFGNAKVGAIITQTPNFEDAVQGWEAAVQQQQLNYHRTLRHTKGDTSWYNVYRDDFAQAGVEVVFVLTSPVDYIRFAQASHGNGYRPQYVGVGVTKGLNAVLGSGCPQVDGGEFFSPFPGLDVVDALDPDFNRAAAAFGKPNDDIALALWGLAKIMDAVLTKYEEAYGSTDLTREDMRALMETMTVSTRIFPDIRWSASDHFGGTGVHVLKADCAAGIHKTIAQFKSSF